MADVSELEAEPLNSKDSAARLPRHANEADVIRYYQKEVLAKDHDVLAPCILNKDLSKIFAQKIINT
jgi:glutamate dehydrogenase/leucine dehydrogenase